MSLPQECNLRGERVILTQSGIRHQERPSAASQTLSRFLFPRFCFLYLSLFVFYHFITIIAIDTTLRSTSKPAYAFSSRSRE